MKLRTIITLAIACLPLGACYVGPDPYVYGDNGVVVESHGYGRGYRHGYDGAGYYRGGGYYHGDRGYWR